MNLNSLINKAEKTHELDKDEIIALLSEGDDELFKAADRVREKYVGREVHLRGLIEFSNICAQNCLYCGLRRDNKNIERYRLEPEIIVEFAKNAAALGYKTIVLQSGEDAFYSIDKMAEIISEIKKFNLAITLSVGEKTHDELKAYKAAGADRYLIRIETTDRELYKKFHPEMDFNNRARCLSDLKKLGYELGTGSLVGLPGQTLESLADDILFFKSSDVDMLGIGPFIANENTPLKDAPLGDNFALSLKMLAIARLLMPSANIPATTATESLRPNGRLIALQSGANVVMPNVGQGAYKKLYKLYPGKICTDDTPEECRESIEAKIKSIGREISTDFGFRRRIL
jgi:biotin synthase